MAAVRPVWSYRLVYHRSNNPPAILTDAAGYPVRVRLRPLGGGGGGQRDRTAGSPEASVGGADRTQ